MSKDTLQKHDQGSLSQVIWDLEKRNHDEFGGRLFSTVGRKDSRAYVFITPEIRQTEWPYFSHLENPSVMVNEFLVAVPAIGEFKLIQIAQKQRRDDVSVREFKTLVEERLGNKAGLFLNGEGYKNGVLNIGDLVIGPIARRNFLYIMQGQLKTENCRMIDASDDRVGEILNVNIERVHQARQLAQKVSQSLG